MTSERLFLASLVFVFLMILSTSCSVGGTVPPTPQPLPDGQTTSVATPVALASSTAVTGQVSGQELFTINCAGCHTSPNKTASDLGELNADRIRETVRQGKDGVMPQFSQSELSDAQLEAIIAYLKSLE